MSLNIRAATGFFVAVFTVLPARAETPAVLPPFPTSATLGENPNPAKSVLPFFPQMAEEHRDDRSNAAAPAQGHCRDRFWFATESLNWNISDTPLPFPLLTAGSLQDARPAVLGQPNTRILYGGENLDTGSLSGVRVNVGFWLDDCKKLGIEGSGFLLQKPSTFFGASSPDGSALLARPFVNLDGSPGVFDVSFPTDFSGSFRVLTETELFGWEANLATRVWKGKTVTADLLGGFRFLQLEERLDMLHSLTPLNPNVGFFLGQPVDTGTTFDVTDQFFARNRIYAPQISGRLTWNPGALSLSLVGKVGLGVNEQEVYVKGRTAFTAADGSVANVRGGVFAQDTNIGKHERSEFVVVPEVGVTAGLKVTDWLNITAGYSVLYCNSVVRPGDQIDPVINPNRVPIDQDFGRLGNEPRPSFRFQDRDFFTHGFQLGIAIGF